MAPLADLILKYVPIPHIPYHYTHYVRGATPLSTQPVVLSMLAAYLTTIFGLREIMKTRQPQKLTFLFQVHNAILSSGSALLLVLMLEEILPIYWQHGLFYALCNGGAWTEVSKPPLLRIPISEPNRLSAAYGIVLYHQLLHQIRRAA
jgi:fatty acid elongase 3